MDKLLPPVMVFPDQRDPASAYRVAFDLLSRREVVQALEVLEPALELEPENHGLRTLRAWAWFIRVQLDKARVELEALVEADPTDAWVRFMLGRTLERQSKYDEALPHLRLAAVMSGDPEHELSVLRVERLRGL
ncbi:tetratricopeptide repeat protein [Nocardioides dubius]|uniref:Tetratricopeptide repeat protein n=1 Tax=Nocardioides dubius TaxID=317019 RepID=A0ABN1TMB3_9ACTN